MNTAYLDPVETLKAIRPMEHVLGKSKIISAANNFLFEFGDEGTTEIHATDTETWMSAALSQTQVQAGFTLLLPGREISRIMSNSALPIEVSSDGNLIKVVADGSKYQFPYLPPDKFPPTPDFEHTQILHEVEVETALLARAFGLVSPAISKEKDGMGVPGVGLFHGQDFIMLATASSARFATTRFRCNWKTGKNDPINIVTFETAKAIGAIDSTDPMTVQSTAQMMRFSWGKNSLVCRTLAKRMPPMKPFMPKGTEPKFVAKAGVVANALKKVQVVEADGAESYADHGIMEFGKIDCRITVKGKHGQAEVLFPGVLSADEFGAGLRLNSVAWMAKSFSPEKDITFFKLNDKEFTSVSCEGTVFTIPPIFRKPAEAKPV